MERKKLAEARYEKGWSQEEASAHIGVTQVTYSKWERGITEPYPLHIHKLCQVFGKSATELDLAPKSQATQGEPDTIGKSPTTQEEEEQTEQLSVSAKQDNKIQEPLSLLVLQDTTTPMSELGGREDMDSSRCRMPQHTLEFTDATYDPGIWFGSKLAHLLSMIEPYNGQPNLCLELQERIGEELNTTQPKICDDVYTHSRRQFLITLAKLPMALLLALLQGQYSDGQTEHFLSRCATSLTACWHLMRGSDYSLAEEILPTYLPLLSNLAQGSSKYQRMAASLSTQGYRLKGILALHQNNAKARNASFQQAVYYAEIAQNPSLLVAALISLAYHQSNPIEAEQLYQKALAYEKVISSLQRSRLYAELSVTYAQQNRENEALYYLNQAQNDYPETPESDPSFLYAEFSPASMVLEKGRVHLALAQHHPDGQHPQHAWETFAAAEGKKPTLIIPARIHYEIINYQAETALALRERDLCCDYVEMGARGAELLGSVRRRKEVLVTKNKALRIWPHDARVKGLKTLFA